MLRAKCSQAHDDKAKMLTFSRYNVNGRKSEANAEVPLTCTIFNGQQGVTSPVVLFVSL